MRLNQRWCAYACALVAVGLLSACGGGGGSNATGAQGPAPGPGTGTQLKVEEFTDGAILDGGATDADWGVKEFGVLTGQPVTTRTVYIYGYEEASNGLNSGRGQYARLPDPLTGQDIGVLPGGVPPTSQGRRMVMAISDTKLGVKGAITGISWGPHANRTNAATYGNVKIRAGYRDPQLPGTLDLASTVASSYAGQPSVLYDGAYTVTTNANVGNTSGHPATPHAGGYPENPGCRGPANGWNEQAFTSTGWYPWPALTNPFDWDPGDPLVNDDSVLLLDFSVQEGDVHQDIRTWFAVTFPCSGLLIAGYQEKMLTTIYEGNAANPLDNFAAGIVNPTPAIADTCVTLSRRSTIGQSKFFPGDFGDDTDYQTPTILPTTQKAGATILVEFQGADSVQADGVTINTGSPFTGWVQDIDLCDGMQNLRFRITLNSDLATLDVARVDSITIGMKDSNP